MSELYLGESGFLERMREEIEPYLRRYRRQVKFLGLEKAVLCAYEYCLPGADKCVVICHGFCEFAEKYNEIVYYFLQKGYSVYVPEHRGHGSSERFVPDSEMVYVESYGQYVEDLYCYTKRLEKFAEPHRYLFAHSMGGAIGVRCLEQHPGFFEKAVLSAPMFAMQTGKYGTAVAFFAAAAQVAAGNGKKYAPGQSGFVATPDFKGSSCVSESRYYYVFQKRLENRSYRTYGGCYRWVLESLLACHALMRKKEREKIKIPILLFSAGKDHMVKSRAHRTFAKGTKNTRLVFVPESKHEIFHAAYETRVRYFETLFTFLETESIG